MSVREQVGRAVGRYEIVREVGRGGMAVVYLARQTDLDRFVALKELAAFRASDPGMVERFLRESRLAGSLSHPNIVTVHEYFEHDGTAFIAMEYFERGSLRPLVGRLRPEQVAGVLEGLLAGLAHAERRGIVHRDLKPENVMITAEGSVKIADFGIAKALQGPPARSLTDDGAAVGTPAYMAPELVTGGEVGPWTDLYALGVMAFELLAGRLPFDDTGLALALMLRHANEPAPPLRSVRPDLDEALAEWVDRLLAKAAPARPHGAAAAAEELDEILLALHGPRWRRHSRLVSVDDAAVVPAHDGGTPVADSGATPALPRPRRRWRRVWIAAAAVVAAVAAAVAAALVLADGSGEPASSATAADLIPPARDRLNALVAGEDPVVGDPAGRLVRLHRTTLSAAGSSRDPARPRSLALARGLVLVADGDGVSAVDPRTLTTRSARALTGATVLAAANGTVAVAATEGTRGRVCVVAAGLRLAPCAGLRFPPSGLGVASGGRVYVADGGGGSIVVFRSTGRRLVRDSVALQVGALPHGRLVFHRGSLYAAVERGIAVVDPSRRVTSTLRLPVTPSDLWLDASSGRLFAALPALDRIAIVDPRSPEAAPRLVRAVREPVAVTGSASGSVFVVGAGGEVARLDRVSGRLLGTRRVAVLDAPPPLRLVLRRIDQKAAADAVTLTFRLDGGTLDETSLVVRDTTIADGAASFELWQGAIASSAREGRVGQLTFRVVPASGRLAVSLTAPAGSYERLRIDRIGPRAIRVTMRETRAPAAASGGTTTGGRTTGGTTTGGTTQPKPPTKPKKPTYDVG